eukprot:TRINITY_DN32032_c0_g1_i1.p1 TRINITY_DN32032_c0_g1~~TRINITY_DN32032_c0_g1_i1.p1  ORF type:complete len:460 (+),score=105.49 TRINITY_DN32032_c0_g1_i1:81-1460(+)
MLSRKAAILLLFGVLLVTMMSAGSGQPRRVPRRRRWQAATPAKVAEATEATDAQATDALATDAQATDTWATGAEATSGDVQPLTPALAVDAKARAAATAFRAAWRPPSYAAQDGPPLDPPRPTRPRAWAAMGNNERVVIDSLAAFHTLRAVGTDADCVLMLFGENTEQLHRQYAGAIQRLDVWVMHVEMPVGPGDVLEGKYRTVVQRANKGKPKWWDFVKLFPLAMEQYEKVIFMDGDLQFRKNCDELFDKPAGTHSDGPFSPFNSGLVVMSPGERALRGMLGLILEGAFTYRGFWNGTGTMGAEEFAPCEAKPKKDASGVRYKGKWGFVACETTQGLFQYYYTCRKGEAAPPTLTRHVYNYQAHESGRFYQKVKDDIKIMHFTGCKKRGDEKGRQLCPEAHSQLDAAAAAVAADIEGGAGADDALLRRQSLLFDMHRVWRIVDETHNLLLGKGGVGAP